MYTELRKYGVIPERKIKSASVAQTLQTFDPKKHEVTGITLDTLKKVWLIEIDIEHLLSFVHVAGS